MIKPRVLTLPTPVDAISRCTDQFLPPPRFRVGATVDMRYTSGRLKVMWPCMNGHIDVKSNGNVQTKRSSLEDSMVEEARFSVQPRSPHGIDNGGRCFAFA
jgi:hypothetical protein